MCLSMSEVVKERVDRRVHSLMILMRERENEGGVDLI